MRPALRLRRALTLLVTTAVVPGTAQLAVGNRRVGRVAVRVWMSLVCAALLLAGSALLWRDGVVGLLVRPWVLTGIQVVLLAVGLGWAALLVDALRLGRLVTLAPRARLLCGGVALALVAAVCVPTLTAARYAGVQRDLVTSVFGDGDAVATADGRINILLLGGDSGRNRVGTRPDSITLVSTDVATGSSVMFSLPRNLMGARFPAGTALAKAFPDGFDGMLNGVYTYGAEHPDLFPGVSDPGAEATKAAVAGTLGIPVHYYVLVDLGGFSGLVDALGGIRLKVEQRVPIGGGTSPIVGWIEPGAQRLDGYHALWYARSREGSSDYARMARQRCVMGALLQQADPATVVRRFHKLAASAKRVVATDIPQRALPGLVELAPRARASKVRSVQFVPPLIRSSRPDFDLIAAKVRSSLAAPPRRTRTAAQSSGSPASGASSAPARRAASGPAGGRTPGAGAGDAVDVTAVCSYA